MTRPKFLRCVFDFDRGIVQFIQTSGSGWAITVYLPNSTVTHYTITGRQLANKTFASELIERAEKDSKS